MGWGTPLTTSERITARAAVQAAADELADAVRGYLDAPLDEVPYFEARLLEALDRYKAARDEARR